MIQQLLNEKGVTDDLADGAIQPGTVTTSGLTAAAQRLLGNKESTAGAIEELTLSQALDLIGSAARGDLLFRGAAGWQRLAAGTSGQFLKTLGAGADPAWDTAGGGSGWELAGSWDQSIDGNKTNIDFTGLGGAQDILLIVRNVTQSVSGQVAARVSVDDGASFFSTSGNYVIPTTAGVESNSSAMLEFFTPGATAARTGAAMIQAANVNGSLKAGLNITSCANHRIFVGSTSPINAVRVYSSGDGTIGGAGGKIYCLVRR
ncbi:hypothetical protein [Sphingomonas segetis]|uniref:hypothetical protein n=1 Tax=Sphingomonas segetis TaxID=1104779 RepID=UPI0012D2A156|nr:hypothetical protein [Sphingomonas segetis]